MTAAGQNFGASAGVDVVWVDDLSQDDFGTSFIVTGGHVHPDESMYSDIQTTTPAPVRGEFKKCLPLAPVLLLTVWSLEDIREL